MPAEDKATFNKLLLPIVAYTALGGLYVSTIPGKWIWFNWHPIAMMGSFVALGANAALIKKIGGLENTRIHGMMSGAATAISMFGWFVIYSNKEMNKRPHLTTIHGKLGVFVLLASLGVGAAGGIFLHPDFGLLKTNKSIRFVHKWAGRLILTAGWACSVLGNFNIYLHYIVILFYVQFIFFHGTLGFMTMEKDTWKQIVFGAPLLFFGYYALL